ncbi:hypothetical protein [Dasania marina]|uniref:hypothetical protein n=1 Tax=Dasania marina TaxID=471499 RepID=UPI0030DAED6C|tara:strand:- start:7758 stop:8099 length:342 start_codon:yes stop_codon:yes gene_type:complete
MIVSITFRHGTEDKPLRRHIGQELLSFPLHAANITRIQVVFSKEKQHEQKDDVIGCHISIHIPNKHPVDIYEYQANEALAFDRAQERVIGKLIQINSSHNRCQKIYHRASIGV